MRTVKRKTLPLNTTKQKALEDLCLAYSREKQYWLQKFRDRKFQSQLGRSRSIRDEMIVQGYRSLNGLQARHWKLALEDAAETWDKYWQANFAKVRVKISRRKDLSEVERHYAYWLIKSYPSFASMMQGKCPEPPFPIDTLQKKHIAGFVRRLLKACKGKSPTSKKVRTIRFDANCYDIFENKGRQYIKVMSLTPGKRISIPLLGKTAVSGTITLVVSKPIIDLHIPQELKPKRFSIETTISKSSLEAVDFGYTEVMTDTAGIRYGTNFGTTLTQSSNNRHQRMQKRHKLHSILQKKKNSNLKQAKRLQKYNLGKKKHISIIKSFQATLEKEINTAINQLIKTKNPSLLITEDLRHTFTYNKSKEINRRLSGWLRGKLQDRIIFKALAEGFRHEQVNPAYGSQSCPTCEYVDHRNRKGDCFQCLHCGHENASDRVAAMNYAKRYGDPEIGLYTPYVQVKTILLNRFHRRLETGQLVTVPGRTLETAVEVNLPLLSRLNIIAGREKSHKNRTVNQRAKRK